MLDHLHPDSKRQLLEDLVVVIDREVHKRVQRYSKPASKSEHNPKAFGQYYAGQRAAQRTKKQKSEEASRRAVKRAQQYTKQGKHVPFITLYREELRQL